MASVGRMVVFCGWIAILLLGVLTSATSGEEVQRLLPDYAALKKHEAMSVFGKVQSSIRTVAAGMAARGINRQNARELGASAFSTPLVKVSEEGSIQTYIHVNSARAEDMARLESHVVKVEIVNGTLGIIQAWIPYSKVYEVSELPFVRRISPPSYAIHNAGSVTTEGDAILEADSLRALGYDGNGVRVGVISDGVDSRATAQATGDLPPTISIVTHAGSGDEGTALMEIVHDLAPGVALGFCGPQTSMEMIQCVSGLAGTTFGASIIVDDVAFLGEPYFEDGPVAQAVRNVLPRVVYVSSAGNFAQGHYERNYQSISYLGGNLHDFGGAAGGSSDATMNVLVAPDGFLLVVLQWNDPFGGSENDYDLYILNETENQILAASTELQQGTDDPIEAVLFQNIGVNPVRVKVAVNKFSGADRFVEMILYGNSQVEEYNLAEGSIIGHAAVSGVLATAAIAANDPGNDDIEFFSSRGPSRIFFPTQETRQKPDITAIDGVSVTGAGGFPTPFYGTSASAPHVAGIAALLREAYPTCATAADIVGYLRKTADDLGTTGTDSTFGAGLANALNAFNAFLFPPSDLSAVPVSEGQINLAWTDNSTNEQSFRIERKIGSGGTYSELPAGVGANITSFNDTGVNESTTYFYRVRAHNGSLSLDSCYSNEVSALTYPAAPSDLSAAPASSTQIDLNWTDNSSGESGFWIERKNGAGGTYSVIASPAPNATSYSDAGLSASTTYFYRVYAYNSSGNSIYFNEVSATTFAVAPSDGGGGGGGCFISTVESHYSKRHK